MKKMNVYLYIGTTAELIKLIPIIKEFNTRKLPFIIVASGQNTIKFEEFSSEIGNVNVIHAITPKGEESSVFKFIIWSFRTFFSLLVWMRRGFKGLNKSNCYFIVHGDTVSSLMGALAAYVYGLKLVHVESGLRSFNFLEPFPEEICRSIISRIADIHFCPNEWAVNNLHSFSGEKINTFQNTLIEVFWHAMKKRPNNELLKNITTHNKKYFVMVSHRQEHIIFNKSGTQQIIQYIIDTMPKNMMCVFVMHDLSADFIKELKSKLGKKLSQNIVLTKRLPYVEYMHLILKSEFMITDGGSNQEEMYYMGKPCLLLRNYTERIEGLDRNIVLSKNKKEVIKQFIDTYKTYISDPVKPRKMPSSIITDYLFP
jgi:UDP-N-acetylglucosamine 2-epimerase (non-hydrolysing)